MGREARRAIKKAIEKAVTAILCVGLMLGTAPTEALAAQPAGGTSRAELLTINLGTAALEDPAQNGRNWSGSKVYFGKLTESGQSKPVLWRVLDASDDVADGAVLLQTDCVIGTEPFWKTENSAGSGSVGTGSGNVGTGSGSSTTASGSDSFLAGFDRIQKAAIRESTKEAEDETQIGSDTYTNPGSEGSKVFLLSAAESTREEYGYGTESARKMVSGGDASEASDWWLRSAPEGSDTEAVVVGTDGRLSTKELQVTEGGVEVARKAGIAPALYLDSEEILFVTPANTAKPQQVDGVEGYTGAKTWKLTLVGNENSMQAAINNGGEEKLFERNQSMELVYNNARSLRKWVFQPTQVSALVLDQTGTPVYYGKLTDNVRGTSCTWTIPADMPSGSYRLYVFAEDLNGEKETDYASALGDALSFQVDEKETPVWAALPTASGITYGQPLGDSALTGGEVKAQGRVLSGTFSWKDATVHPSAADSGVTRYEITFVPQEADRYYELTASICLTVGKAQIPGTLPADQITVDYGIDQVKEIALPAGWSWKQEFLETYLTAGSPLQAAVVYQDAVNYEGAERIISILRSHCAHAGETEIRNAKEASCTEEGYTGDTYCLVCGALLTRGQVITKKAHYYYGTRTLQWQGCEQQGEVEHFCGCGDSYLEISPALGHDFKEEVTRKATKEQEGIKTYTCTRCGHSYTEPIPRLKEVTQSVPQETGASDHTVADRKPFVKGNPGISGWNDINRHILKAAENAQIQIDMSGSLILPKKTLETLQGKKVTLLLDIGDQMQWSITGAELLEEPLSDINLKVTRDSAAIPADLVRNLAGERRSLQLSFVQEGSFPEGMKLNLSGAGEEALYANLFSYRTGEEALVYQCSIPADAERTFAIPVSQALDTLIVLDTAEFDGSLSLEPEQETQQEEPAESQTKEPEETIAQEKEEGISIIVIIAAGLIVLGAGLLVIVFLRARSRRTPSP